MTATSSIADVVDERAREMYLDTYEALTPAAAASARATIKRDGGAFRATLRDGKRRETDDGNNTDDLFFLVRVGVDVQRRDVDGLVFDVVTSSEEEPTTA